MNTALEKRLKRQVIGKPHRFLAVVPLGFEQTFVNELEYIRKETKDERREATIAEQPRVVGDGKVEFTAKITEAWKIVAYSRIANRVLMHIADFKAENFREFEKKASEVPWELYLDERTGKALQTKDERRENPNDVIPQAHNNIGSVMPVCKQPVTTLASHVILSEAHRAKSKNPVNSCDFSLVIHVTCKHSRLYHSDAIAERLQKIIFKTFSSLDPSTLNVWIPSLRSRMTALENTSEPTISASHIQDAKPQSKATSHLKVSETSDLIAHRSYPQHLYVNFLDDRCTIWLDLAGEELYKRGFERFVNDAPLKETIAAAMLFEAIHLAKPQEILRLRATPSTQDDTAVDPIGASRLQDDRNKNLQHHNNDNVSLEQRDRVHEKTSLDSSITNLRFSTQDDKRAKPQSECNERPHTSHPITLIDPMSGSGTFSLEAACIANNIIPGVCRDFALKHQPAFKEATWKHILGNRFQVTGFKIITSDISERSIEIIKHNVECSPLANITPSPVNPLLKDFFSYTAEEIANISTPASTSPCDGDKSNESQSGGTPIILLNPPYGKRLDFDAPKLYTKIGKKLAELAHDLKTFNKSLTVAILAPKDDTHPGSKYTCTANLLRECPTLAPNKNSTAKLIETSHGGFSLNVFIARI